MKKRYKYLLAVLLAGIGAFLYFTRDKREINVLVFSKTEKFRHESIAAGKAAIQQLGKQHGFRVDTTEQSEVFTEKKLSR